MLSHAFGARDPALHRSRARHWQDKAAPEQMAALTARVEASSPFRTAATVARLVEEELTMVEHWLVLTRELQAAGVAAAVAQ